MFSQSFKAHFSPSGFYTIQQLTWGRIAIINGIFAAEGFFFVPGRWTEKAEKQDGERKRARESGPIIHFYQLTILSTWRVLGIGYGRNTNECIRAKVNNDNYKHL